MKNICRNILCLIIFAGFFLHAGCSSSGKKEFAEKRDTWRTKKIGDYRYSLKWVAFSPQEFAGKVADFEVRDGKNVLTDCPKCETRTPEFFRQFDTMDKIFDYMEKTINKNPYSFEIKYNENFSVPLRFDVEEKGPNTSDDQWYFAVRDFQPLK